MNKQEILDEINKTKEHLANMEKMLEKYEYESWKPSDCETYWFLSTTLLPVATVNKKELDRERCNAYNCFKTEEEAKAEAEKILVRRMLENIARRLNKGRKIDWNDENQYKWYILYNKTFDVASYSVYGNKAQGTVYCLDENFRAVAIQEIGEERLKKYLRGE